MNVNNKTKQFTCLCGITGSLNGYHKDGQNEYMLVHREQPEHIHYFTNIESKVVNNKVHCPCGSEYKIGNKSHMNSKKHKLYEEERKLTIEYIDNIHSNHQNEFKNIINFIDNLTEAQKSHHFTIMLMAKMNFDIQVAQKHNEIDSELKFMPKEITKLIAQKTTINCDKCAVHHHDLKTDEDYLRLCEFKEYYNEAAANHRLGLAKVYQESAMEFIRENGEAMWPRENMKREKQRDEEQSIFTYLRFMKPDYNEQMLNHERLRHYTLRKLGRL